MALSPVLITGMGAISAAGRDCSDIRSTFRCGQRETALPTDTGSPLAKPVFQVRHPLPGSPDPRMRTLRLALQATDEALARAPELLRKPSTTRVGVCLGTTVACQLNDIEFYQRLRNTGQVGMETIDRYLQGNLAAAVAGHYGFSGPTLTVTNACSSGTDAIGIAMGWLRHGVCDAALAGGADELNRVPLAGFNALGIMSDAACKPFDRDRNGLNLGEGAGVLLLETLASARRNDHAATVRCDGYGTVADAYHLTAPREDGSGLETAIRLALDDAGIAPASIAFTNAHGTATPTNDAVEGSVLARVFGADLTVSATKGYTGHTLGGAGGLEAVFTAMALDEQWLPASAGFSHADPAIPLAPVDRVTPVNGAYAISTSLAFGGNNSALVLGRKP